jgi:hypothetical protein
MGKNSAGGGLNKNNPANTACFLRLNGLIIDLMAVPVAGGLQNLLSELSAK